MYKTLGPYSNINMYTIQFYNLKRYIIILTFLQVFQFQHLTDFVIKLYNLKQYPNSCSITVVPVVALRPQVVLCSSIQ